MPQRKVFLLVNPTDPFVVFTPAFSAQNHEHALATAVRRLDLISRMRIHTAWVSLAFPLYEKLEYDNITICSARRMLTPKRSCNRQTQVRRGAGLRAFL